MKQIITKKKKSLTVGEFRELLGAPLRLELLAGKSGLDRVIRVAEVNRPGLALAGYMEYFARLRIQVLGKVELTFLNTLPHHQVKERLDLLLNSKIPCIIIARKYTPPKVLLQMCEKYRVPIFRSPFITMRIINKITVYLDNLFAPSTCVHGSLLEVYGVGVLITGKSGIGKSECALSLIARGHRMIADDIVKIHVEDGVTLIGESSEITSHHMELRGLGIIDIQSLFGVGCIRDRKRIDINVHLEEWNADEEYDRLGLEQKQKVILSRIEIPFNVIPVRPGRDVALLIEAAALNQRLKWMGRNPALELNQKLSELLRKNKNS